MAIEFSTALGLIKAMTNTAKGLADAPTEAEVNDVSVRLQDIILDLQSELMLIQSDYQYVLRERDNLIKKLIDQENWEKERARYRLKKVGPGVFVYEFNVTQPLVEPAHWICAHCYEDKKKSIIQRNPFPHWVCPRCQTSIIINDWPDNFQKE